MRIYQINVVCGTGSTGRIAVDLSRAIENAGGTCRIAYGRGTAPRDADTIKISNQFDLYYHAFMTRLTGKHGLYSKHATKKIIVDIQEYKPDIIHLHNIHGYYVNYKILFQFLKEYNKPVVWTMHDCWAFTGHCAHYEEIGCYAWQKMCENCVNLNSYPATWSSKNVEENFNLKKEMFSSLENLTIVTPSVWLAKQLNDSFMQKVHTITINNGIDLNLFKPYKGNQKELLFGKEKKVVLGVASVWTNSKGLEDFIRLREILDNEYLICLIGLNKEQIEKLPDGIVGIRKTANIEELVRYYSLADVFLNPTYEDTFPTTNIEALACGTPVITYETGGCPESILPECGAVVKTGDLEALACSLRKWCEKEKPINECMQRARCFNKDMQYEKYIELYGSISI